MSDYDERYKAAKPSTEDIVSTLLGAADILEVDGWGQSAYHLADGCHCALGAIGLAAGFHREGIDPLLIEEAEANGDNVEDYLDLGPDEAPFYAHDNDLKLFRRYDESQRALTRHIGGNYVPHWNDIPGQTAEHVIATIREAASKLVEA